MERRWGWKRDSDNGGQDRRFGVANPNMVLPPKIDLRDRMPVGIQDQGDRNACIFYSLAAIIQHLDRANTADDFEWFPSVLFMYWNTRELEGDVDADDGAEIRNAIKSVASTGVCTNDDWPEQRDVRQKPPANCYAVARNGIIRNQAKVPQNMKSIRQALAAGSPILFGFYVFDQFESDEMARTGILAKPEGEINGGHAVVAVGYDDADHTLLVRNSWGPHWGLPAAPGHFLMPYDYALRDASDFWVINALEGIK